MSKKSLSVIHKLKETLKAKEHFNNGKREEEIKLMNIYVKKNKNNKKTSYNM